MNYLFIIGFAILSFASVYVAAFTAGYGFTYGSLTAKKKWARQQIKEMEKAFEGYTFVCQNKTFTKNNEEKEKSNGME